MKQPVPAGLSGNESLALLTDLYQLTMACAYWKSGRANQEAAFHLFFRQAPFQGGFTLACGLETMVDYLQGWRFDASDLAYLSGLKGGDNQPLFEPGFLDELGRLRFTCDVAAVPEGTVVFAQEPLVRVQGPLLQAQLVESALLNIFNFQSLIATKAARICLAARGEPVIEFGLRRAQGMDGGLTASRAAYLGGCIGTSHVLAGKRYGIPVKGTHAHSWVMCFDSELEAFLAYAQALPNNCIFLVDTYDTLEGVRHAVAAGRRLRQQGHRLAGIRLDSGDLASLSIAARRILDEGGFPDAVIVGSNDLDEHLIDQLKQQGATINVWGVGTRLVTAYDQPALGGVYKLGALRRPDGTWESKIKISDQPAKTTTPGLLQVHRLQTDQEFLGDVICDDARPVPEPLTMVDLSEAIWRPTFPPGAFLEPLLQPVLRAGQLVRPLPALPEIRERAQRQLAMLTPGMKRLAQPEPYPVGLEMGLYEQKMRLIQQTRGKD